jgi:rod shape-determining protein MreC
MENLISRHRNVSILVAVLFAQVLGLAVQVKRSTNTESTSLMRVWVVTAITPLEKVLIWTEQGVSNLWRNYVYLRGVRTENRELRDEIERLRLEQVRMSQDAEQARRLQLLLGFKERFISKTVAAQVIGSSGSDQSRSVYIDKGARDGVQPDQPVITADGVVGKVLRAYGSSPLESSGSLVLLINDPTSGVGVILEKSRLQGVLRGTPSGGVTIDKIMNDEPAQVGERVLTSGGDQVFPKGIEVGTITQVTPGAESFLNIRVKPAVALSKLEEVLVVTKIEDKTPTLSEGAAPLRAADILAQRLPSVPDKPAVAQNPPSPGAVPFTKPAPKPLGAVPPVGQSNAVGRPAGALPHTKAPAVAPGEVRPAGASGSGPSPATVKPAAVQKPVPPATKSAGKSATPAPAQPKPDSAPAEATPQ